MSTNSDRRHLLAAMSLVVTANETTGSTPTMGRSRPIAKHQGLAEEASEVEFWRECHDWKKSAMRARTLGYTHSDMLRARPNPPPFPSWHVSLASRLLHRRLTVAVSAISMVLAISLHLL